MMFFKKIYWGFWRLWIFLQTAIITIALFPFLYLSVLSPKTFGFFGVLAKVWSYYLLITSCYFPQVKGRENIKKGRQYIVVANHSSWIDIPLVYAIMPRGIKYIGKRELARFPFFGPVYSATNILVDRKSSFSGGSIIRQTYAEIQKGHNICIFPEGTTRKKEFLTKFKDGAFLLAIECRLPILPITFLDSQRKFPSDCIVTSPGRLRIIVDEPVDTSSYTLEQKDELKQRVWNLLSDNYLKNRK